MQLTYSWIARSRRYLHELSNWNRSVGSEGVALLALFYRLLPWVRGKENVGPAQNRSLSASWPTLAAAAVVITPKPASETVESGSLKLAWLSALKNSARNWSASCSRRGKSLLSPMSQLNSPGPRRPPFEAFPNRNG